MMLNNQLRKSAHNGAIAVGIARPSLRRFFHYIRRNKFDYDKRHLSISAMIPHPCNLFTCAASCSLSKRRYLSVFRDGGIFSLIGDIKNHLPAWHNPNFMENDPIEVKESWLENQIRYFESNLPTINNNTASRKSSKNSSDNALLDIEAYNFILKSWAREATSNKAAAFHAEKWLLRLRHEYNSSMSCNDKEPPQQYSSASSLVGSNTSNIQPNVESYNAVLQAWSKSSEAVAVLRAERWLAELGKLKSTNDRSVEKVTDAGNWMVNRDSDTNLGPTTESYNYYLATLSKGIGKTKQDIQANALKAEQTLRSMISQWEKYHNLRDAPNIDSFNYVMTAITRCKSDPTIADRVMEWLRLMEAFQRSSAVSDSTSRSILDIRPNTKSYSIAISAWGILAQQKAEASVRELRRQRAVSGEQLNKWRASSSTDQQQSAASSRMSNDGHDEARKAKAILDYMHAIHSAGSTDVIPDTYAYNSVIGTWSKISSEYNASAPLRAEEVLREMMHLFDSGGYPEVNPDNFSYTQVRVFFPVSAMIADYTFIFE